MRLNQTVVQLNSYLHGELSAVEGYKKALEMMHTEGAHSTLEKCEQSHETRAEMLKRRIVAMGGRPAASSAPWPVTAGADAQVIEQLDRLEEQELGDYRREVSALDSESRGFVERTIIPEASKMHDEIERLKRTIH